MKINWYHKLNKALAFTALALLATTSANAIPREPCDPAPCNVCCEEPPPGPFAFSYPKDLRLSCPQDVYFSAEFLYFQAQEQGLDLGLSGNVSGDFFPFTGGDVLGFSGNSDNWGWNPGFRLGLGFYLCHDVWSLQAAYTHLNVGTETNVHLNGGALLAPFWVAGDAASSPALDQISGRSRWDMRYNTFDLRLGKPYHVSRYMISHPHIGARAAWITQDYVDQYDGFFTTSPGTFDARGAEMDGDVDFWAIGTRVGLDTEWLLGSGFGLYGNVAGSLLFSKFDVDQTWRAGNNASEDEADLNWDIYTTTPNVEAVLGIFWGMPFCCQKYYVTVSAAYEFHYWWNMNQLRNWTAANGEMGYNQPVARGDMSFNGFSIKLQFDF